MQLCSEQLLLAVINQTSFHLYLNVVNLSAMKLSDVKNFHVKEIVFMYHSWLPEDYQTPESTHLSSGWYDQIGQQTAIVANKDTLVNLCRLFRYLEEIQQTTKEDCETKHCNFAGGVFGLCSWSIDSSNKVIN